MNTNPYQAPREASQRAGGRGLDASQWVGPWLLILVVAYVIASLLTPADPFSSLLGAIPVFIAMILARWFGFRAGHRQAEARLDAERGDDG